MPVKGPLTHANGTAILKILCEEAPHDFAWLTPKTLFYKFGDCPERRKSILSPRIYKTARRM